jgi:hypothetical protein
LFLLAGAMALAAVFVLLVNIPAQANATENLE